MSNINSFSQNMNRTVAQSANTLAMLTAMQKSMTSNDTFVAYDYQDGEGNNIKYQLPSYESVINRLRAVEESLNSITNGKGVINLNDGSRRTISVSSIPHTPEQITGLPDPSTFTVDSNWFFENLMFPGAQVNIDLTGQIEDTADRVRIVRIILNSNNASAQQFWTNEIENNSPSYVDLKNSLEQQGIAYYEDEETIDMPLVANQVNGYFQVTEDPVVINDNIWFTLDNITYSTISSDGTDQGQNNILSVGDQLSYLDSIFEVVAINQNTNQIRIKKIVGVQEPGVYSVFAYYEDPFRSKVVKIRFGAHEYNIIYIKGIAENYNLIADSWSTPIKFSSDDLVLSAVEGSSNTSFVQFYNQYIMDWGAKMIAETKEHRIAAWHGSIPNAPTINGDDFRVVQINTQINAAIDTTDVKNTAAEIQSVKSQISSLKSTIAAQKTDLQSAANLSTYNSIQQQIATNTTDLNNLQTTYTTLVDSFQTIVRENSALTTVPKYHIRGFFPVPVFKYQDEDELIPEEIIGFDIAYRYIREDSTATQLNTFTYTDTDGVSEITGTFTDWIVENGPMKTKVYDTELQRYVWKSENVADGTENNINQIDIAINKGEKVEIKVRSISEAGYPENPLRSEWSNSIIVEFPSTLATSNEVADLITMVNDDALNLTVMNTLQSMGVDTHLDDTIPNTNSLSGMYYKHTAENIAYEENSTDENGISVVNSISVQKKIDDMVSVFDLHDYQIKKNVLDISTINAEMKEKHAQYEERFSYTDTSIKILDISVNTLDQTVKKFYDSSTNSLFTTKLMLNNTNNTPAVSLTSLNQYELFVVNAADGNSSDTSLGAIHTNVLYVHPDGATTSTRYSVYDMIQDVSIIARTNTSDISELTDYARDISTRIVVMATQSQITELSEHLSEHDEIFNTYIDANGNILAPEKIILGKNSELNFAANGTGSLSVFSGMSSDLLSTIHVADIALHTAGVYNSEETRLTTINDNLNNTISELNEQTEILGDVKKTVDRMTSNGGEDINVNTVTVSNKVDAKTISGEEFVINNNDGVFRPNRLGGLTADAEFGSLVCEIGTDTKNVGDYVSTIKDDLDELTSKFDYLNSQLKSDDSNDIVIQTATISDLNVNNRLTISSGSGAAVTPVEITRGAMLIGGTGETTVPGIEVGNGNDSYVHAGDFMITSGDKNYSLLNIAEDMYIQTQSPVVAESGSIKGKVSNVIYTESAGGEESNTPTFNVSAGMGEFKNGVISRKNITIYGDYGIVLKMNDASAVYINSNSSGAVNLCATDSNQADATLNIGDLNSANIVSSKDVSIHGNLSVGTNSSINGNLDVKGDVSIGGTLYVKYNDSIKTIQQLVETIVSEVQNQIIDLQSQISTLKQDINNNIIAKLASATELPIRDIPEIT